MFISFVFLIFVYAVPGVAPADSQPVFLARAQNQSRLTGVYRIDTQSSDKLYSVVAGASSTVPSGEQQRFFIDLAVRLTPPDLLAIERNGNRVSLGSSRAARMTFVADGVKRNTRAQDGHIVQVKFAIETVGNESLVFTSTGRTEDNFTIVFESVADGRQLRVTRRIEAEALAEPIVIKTIYNKVSDVARWELYGEAANAASANASTTPSNPRTNNGATATEADGADVMRRALNDWIEATNKRDIERQMSFYAPRLRAYYLTRNTPRDFVRKEKQRVFASARVIDIRADEPEIIFLDGGRTAVMRYRKQYRVENGRQSRRGQVIQELRWERSGNDWRIFSERDIRVLRS